MDNVMYVSLYLYSHVSMSVCVPECVYMWVSVTVCVCVGVMIHF